MDDEEALKESVSNLRSAILLRRTDIVRSILSTAAECKFLFEILYLCFCVQSNSVDYIGQDRKETREISFRNTHRWPTTAVLNFLNR